MSLLDKALNSKPRQYNSTRTLSDEERELIIAWVDNEITLTQVATAKDVSSSGAYAFLAYGLKMMLNEDTNGSKPKTKKRTK